jgi:2-hydroxy-3-keto-5-methylthiopentenyl-1-phosphate phosphatase
MNILVTDFDGTLTRFDFFDLVRKRWPVRKEDDPWEKYVAGQITHFEALAEIFARIRTDERTLLELADSMDLDPDLDASLQKLREHDWQVVVASAGCSWYIERLLGRTNTPPKIFSNPGAFHPERGLLMSLPSDSPFLDPATGVDKVAIVRDALQRGDRVAFAGDGRPDLEPALLVPPRNRFATRWLANALGERGEDFQPFARWSEIADRLTC